MGSMVIMLGCGALLLVGLCAGFVWAGRPFVAPATVDAPGAGEVARRFAWYVAVALVAGVGAGITVIGVGGRLAMRLLAATAGDPAQGRITEADEVVGEITVGGTIGFVVFVGILGGIASMALYLAVRRFLPPGRLGAALYGLALVVVFGATIDPLRSENPDFDLVGPSWLAVLVFVALAVAYGVAAAGFAARASAWLPPLAKDRRVLRRWALPAALAAAGFTVTAVVVVVGLAVVAATRWRPLTAAPRSARWLQLGRIAVASVVLVSAPGALTSFADILGR
jgi:hypothetical protein